MFLICGWFFGTVIGFALGVYCRKNQEVTGETSGLVFEAGVMESSVSKGKCEKSIKCRTGSSRCTSDGEEVETRTVYTNLSNEPKSYTTRDLTT